MASTEELIGKLTGGLTPVARLARPGLRALGPIALATALIVLLVLLRGFRADLGLRLAEPSYLLQLSGAWLTGAAATLAAFETSLADRSRTWLLLPLPPLVLWLSGFGWTCLVHWIEIPSGAPIASDSMRCLETILLASIPLAFVLWRMLARSRPLAPAPVAWAGALAIAAFADSAHLLIHVVQASALVLVINLIPAAVIIALGGVFGRRGLAPAFA
jgi:hypothetical protein